MKTLSEQLSALADRTKTTEDTVDAALAKNRAKLEAQRDALKASAGVSATKAKADVAQTKAAADTKVAAVRVSLDQRFSEMTDRARDRRAERDIKKAGHHADVAERDASDSIDLALYTLDQAESAIIDAVIARADADAQATPATAG